MRSLLLGHVTGIGIFTRPPAHYYPIFVTSTSILALFHIRPPVNCGASTPKEQVMGSRVEQGQGILGGTFAIPTLLFFSFWMFGTLVTMQFGYVRMGPLDEWSLYR